MLPPMSRESWTVIGVGVVLLGFIVTGQIQTRSAIDSVRDSVSQLETRMAVVEYILQDRLPKVASADTAAD